VLGRVSFYTVFVAINALTLVTAVPLERDDDLSALVGFWWLPPERPYSVHAVSRGETGHAYHAPTYRPFGPFHPLQNKAAAIGITRNGSVSLVNLAAEKSLLIRTRSNYGIMTGRINTKKPVASWNR
jgi:mediator of RNA polymerase II transcription subunit 16